MFDLRSHKKNILLTILLFAESGLLVLLFFSMTFFTELPFTLKNSQTTANPFVTLSEKELSKKISKMETQNSNLEKQINRTVAGQSYMVVNVSTNKFRLFTKGKMVREGLCSTGTNVLLTTDNEKKKWFFSTPKGMHTIIGKTTSPVWIKPDWAFVEEGLPIPPANSDLRYEYGVLGDYAMSLGHGYLIHGTLYKRFLGMPATHGCIRLDDEDLEVVYTTLSIGSKVFIF